MGSSRRLPYHEAVLGQVASGINNIYRVRVEGAAAGDTPGAESLVECPPTTHWHRVIGLPSLWMPRCRDRAGFSTAARGLRQSAVGTRSVRRRRLS